MTGLAQRLLDIVEQSDQMDVNEGTACARKLALRWTDETAGAQSRAEGGG